MKLMYTYIMAHIKNKLFYVGVTNDIKQRTFDYKNATQESHAGKYNIKQLVWFEKQDDPKVAIGREKLINKWKREYKINLIEVINPEWNDLAGNWDFTGYITSKKRFE